MILSAVRTSLAALIAASILSGGCGDNSEREKQHEEKPLEKVEVNVNLVKNPGFTKWDGFKPADWTLTQVAGEGINPTFYGRSEKTKSGKGSSAYVRGVFKTDRWLALSQTFPAAPGHEIILSADMMSEGLRSVGDQKDVAGLYVRFFGADGERLKDRHFADAWSTKRIGDTKWSRSMVKVKTPMEARTMEVGLVNLMTGYIYFDNVSLIVRELVGWKSEETDYIVFHWLEERPFPHDDMKRLEEMIADILEEVGIEKPEKKINYYMYPDPESFMKILQRKRYRTVAAWGARELHTVDSYNDHEMIHLALYDLGRPPAALAKGLVFHFRAKYNKWDMNVRCKRLLLQRHLPALYKTVSAKAWTRVNHSVVIPAWSSFVSFLIDRYGMEKLLELYTTTDGMEEERPFSEAFEKVYGKEFQEVDRDWRLFLMRYEYDAEADTLPGIR